MEWKTTNLESVQPMDYDPHPFESLVIDEKIKDLLQATIEPLSKPSLTQQPEYRRDTVGQSGVVILLHGAPGTGKSMTAQCVADYTKRPLLSLSIEKIGVAAMDTQDHLTEAFQLAEHWDGIIFIDHADVLLEERATIDLARSSIVTVLLRALDYYQGILVLATNLVGTFDEAFKSRIHLAFHYTKLTTDVRYQIWANIFTQLRRTDGPNIDVENLTSGLPCLATYNMNGREIHNAITTARQLSQFKGSKLNYEYLQDAITVRDSFSDYLREITSGREDDEYRGISIRI
ncbi:P-loop containing nucleoside triphosphate hydrolase protein [Thozetella sp. PMI_491]|nr:P-loop containing nucleoside triphosphate hydrolase protein [Thozetella sp. PMI_491]